MRDHSAAKGRILIVIRQFFPVAAGAETQALRQARSYIEMGHDATVVTARHDTSLCPTEIVDGVRVVRLPAPRVRYVGSIVFLWSLAAYLIRRRHTYDAILSFHLKQASAVTATVSAILRKRLIVSVQAAGAGGDVRALDTVTFGPLILRACRRARAFVSGARAITDELIGAGFDEERIHLIPNGIPVEAFTAASDKSQLRRKLGLPKDVFVAVNVGRHTAQKDLRTVLEAWREFAQAHREALLVLVGDGDERRQLESFVAENYLSGSVRFEGWRAEVADYLGASDVFVSSSLFEGTHIALGEAMAASLPVIATAVGGARDFLEDSINGFLVQVGGHGEVAERLALIARDPALRERMGKSAHQTAFQRLSQGETAKRHLALLLPTSLRHTQRRRRITHVIATLDRGGTELQMAELATQVDRHRFQVDVLVLTRGGPTGRILDEGGISWRVLGKKGKIDPGCLFSLIRLLLHEPPDILHTWLFTSNTYGRIAALAAGVKRIIVSERSTDPWKGRLHRALDVMLAVATDVICANSIAVKESLVENCIIRNKVRIVRNGVDCARFRPRNARDVRYCLGLPVECAMIGFVGRLAFEKNPEVFIDVARHVLARNDQARAVLFGSGELEECLRRQAGDIGERVIFYGDCDQPELAHAALDILVLTSRWEGSANVVLEAMACGRPVVAFRMAATSEIIDDGETGVLVDGAAEQIAEAVEMLLADPRRASDIGRKARSTVQTRFSMDRMVADWQALYKSLATASGQGAP